MKKYAISFVFVLLLAHYHNANADSHMDATYWLNEFNRLETIYRSQWDLESSPCVIWPLRDAGVLTWRDSMQALPAYLDMYKWSGQLVYLDLFVARADQIVSYAVDLDSDGYPGWQTIRPGANANGEFIIFDLAIAGTLMRFVNLAGDMPEYAGAAMRYRAIAEPMAAKWSRLWVQLADGRGVYVHEPDGTIPPRSLPLNMQAIAGIYHYKMGHTEQATAILRTVESVLRPHPTRYGALVWNYADNILPSDGIVTTRVDDFNHAATTMRFLLRTRPDLAPSILQTSLSAWDGNRFYWRIDGTENLPADVPPHTYFFPYYRHMETGPELYDAVAAQWQYMLGKDIDCKAGSYLSIPALVLLHKFPRTNIWLPVIRK